MKRIEVMYFAALREQRGMAREVMETSAGTPGELYAELQLAHNLKLPLAILRCAINDEFASMDHKLESGDEVTFIPPVAGG